MKQINERKVISRKQMSTKLLDSLFGWVILFGLAVGLVQSVIDIPLAKFLEGTVYSIVTAIISLVGYTVQWMFTARIAVKNTFKKYTVNKDQSKGILNKSIIVYSLLNLIVAAIRIYATITANNNLALWGAEVDITLPIILYAIIGVSSVGIIIYMTNTQKEYIETQCVEGMPEEKIKMSVVEKVLLIIIGVILVVAIGWAIKVGVIDRQAMENDKYDYGFLEDDYEENSDSDKIAEDKESTIKSDVIQYDWTIETNIEYKPENLKYVIQEGQLLYYNIEKGKEMIADIEGTPKYLAHYAITSDIIDVLTEEGDVFYCLPYEGQSGKFIKRDISDKNIKEMGLFRYDSVVSMYYLTDSGEIIDQTGTKAGTFNSMFGSSNMDLYFKKGSSNIWFLNYDNNKYIVMKDIEDNNIEAKYIFSHNCYESDKYIEEFIIITKNNEMMHYDFTKGKYNEAKVTKIQSNKVSKIRIDKDETYRVNLIFDFEDGSKITISDIKKDYYDVLNKQTINMKSNIKLK